MVPADADRDTVEVLAAEFADRLRRGEQPDVEEYAGRCPDRADEIRDLFPTVALMERTKAAAPAPRPERLGDYRILSEIGRGGMGIVYAAEQLSLGRTVAVKVLPRAALLEPKHLARFRNEARTVGRLHHTHVVPVYGAGDQDGLPYYVMPLIAGVGLDEVLRFLAHPLPAEADRRPLLAEAAAWLRGSGPADYFRNAAAIGADAADALEAAHVQGILHRDLKPGNLLLEPTGHVWLSDFGLAKALESPKLTTTGFVVGTVAYLGPEVLDRAADVRSDVYSLGVTLYELITGRPAYRDADQVRLVMTVMTKSPPPPRQVNPAVPRELETIILKAMARDPAQRYATAGELAADLRRFLDGQPIRARRQGPVARLGRWARRHPVVAGLSGAVALLLLALAGVSTTGYLLTRQALETADAQRQRSEATARVALEALDRLFARFAPRQPGTPAGDPTGNLPPSPALSPEAAAILEEQLRYYDHLARQAAASAPLRRATARAHLRIGDLHRRLGRYEEALAAYRDALDLYTPSDRAEVGLVYNEIGGIHLLRQEREQARAAFRQARAVLAEPVYPEERYELARACYLEGRHVRRPPVLGEPPTRPAGPPADLNQELVGAALTLLQGLRREYPGLPSYRHLLACCHRELGPWGPGEVNAEALRLLRDLTLEYPDAPEYLHDLGETLACGDLRSLPADQVATAEGRLLEALTLLGRLTDRHPHIPAYLIAAAHTHHKLAGLLRHHDRGDEAEPALRRAVELQARAVAALPQAAVARAWLEIFQKEHQAVVDAYGPWESSRRVLGRLGR